MKTRSAIYTGFILLICIFNFGLSKGETTIDSLFFTAEQQIGTVSHEESIAAFKAILSRDDQYTPAYNALANLYLQVNTVNGRQRAADQKMAI